MRLLPNWFILKLSTFSFPAPFMHADSIHCQKMWRKLGLVLIIRFNNRLINFSNLASAYALYWSVDGVWKGSESSGQDTGVEMFRRTGVIRIPCLHGMAQ